MHFSSGMRWSKSMVHVRLGNTTPSPNFRIQNERSPSWKTGFMVDGVRLWYVLVIKSK